MKLLTDMEMGEVVGGVYVEASVGLNSPNGPKTVIAPETATPGLINAFTQVTSKGPGLLSNIDINIVP